MSDEGRLVSGRYRLTRRIGAGAMGVVWQAKDERLQRVVAVKQLLLQPNLEHSEAEEAKQRAMREGRIAARLQHPNAIGVFDVAEDDGAPWLVMEYLPSRSLAAVVSDEGPLPPREVARIGAQVALALWAAHQAGIVHRDVKPGNILIGDDGTVKITDFGISRAQGDVTVTRTGMLAGTPAYLAPEVAKGYEPGAPSDVFSLGSTLYAVVEGEPPFGLNENTLALLHSVAAGVVRPPQMAGPLTPVLMHLLRPQPNDRPNMTQASEALSAVAAGRQSALSTPPGGWATVVTPTTQLPNGPSAPTQSMPPALQSHPQALQSPRLHQGSGPHIQNQQPMTRLDARPLSDAPMTRVGPPTPPPRPHPATSTGGRPIGPIGPVGPGGPAKSAPPPERSRRKTILLAAAAVVVAALVGVLIANYALNNNTGNAGTQTSNVVVPQTTASATKKTTPKKTTAESTSSSTTTSATTTSAAPTLAPEDMVSEVKKYYALLPDRAEAAWQRLGPAMQQKTPFASYKKFWDDIKDVEVGDVTAQGKDKVKVQLTYTKKNGEQNESSETRVLTMIPNADTGAAQINGDQRTGGGSN
ncbi:MULTISPECIES: serine/threonine-protein kinase [unclassified Crossiella]|uniref:serine/threonine-protein kinase n=1 Tax=unclassified Crossiella TaxID=2620835 RepID=UPI001FFF5913|nr:MULTISPECIES: serine/threonine-protein kinase [unclassified Crossiella]MCK2236964.1 serine/threonine protein kinase [Crossiella sp. S99.2]MCK2250632.1 serine/threonine protein kinase [Crossiella sp. S99.1]